MTSATVRQTVVKLALVASFCLVLLLSVQPVLAAPFETSLSRRDNGRCECYSSTTFKYKDGSAAKCQHPINWQNWMTVWGGATSTEPWACGSATSGQPTLDQICCDEDACGDEHNCGGVRDGQDKHGYVYGTKS